MDKSHLLLLQMHLRLQRKNKENKKEQQGEQITSTCLAPSGTSSNMRLAIRAWQWGLKLRSNSTWIWSRIWDSRDLAEFALWVLGFDCRSIELAFSLSSP
jgi:hypothetical protein